MRVDLAAQVSGHNWVSPKLGRALQPNLISHDLHVTMLPITTPPIDKASRNGGV